MISTREAEAAATRRRPPWAVMAVVAAGYAAGSTTAFVLFEASDIGAMFFPPAGVTLAALLLTRTAAWPWLLGTVAAVEMVVNLAFGLPMASVPGFALANVVEPLVGATLLRRFGGDLDLRRRRALGAFIGWAVLAGPFVGALCARAVGSCAARARTSARWRASSSVPGTRQRIAAEVSRGSPAPPRDGRCLLGSGGAPDLRVPLRLPTCGPDRSAFARPVRWAVRAQPVPAWS